MCCGWVFDHSRAPGIASPARTNPGLIDGIPLGFHQSPLPQFCYFDFGITRRITDWFNYSDVMTEIWQWGNSRLERARVTPPRSSKKDQIPTYFNFRYNP